MTAQHKRGMFGSGPSPLGAGCGPAGARSRCCAASRRRFLRAVAASRQRLFWKRSHPPGSSFLHVATQSFLVAIQYASEMSLCAAAALLGLTPMRFFEQTCVCEPSGSSFPFAAA